MRQFLVTKLVCSECNSVLELEYRNKQHVPCADEEPTGADMVELAVAVKPCQTCFAPLRKIKEAVKTLASTAA